jgi:hypothetical protein
MTQRRWIAVACLAIGLVAVAAGLPQTWLADGGWPWTASVSDSGGAARAEIVHADGRVETSAGSRAEVDAWLASRQAELKRQYGIDDRIAAGRVGIGAGLVLLIAGGILLIGRRRAISQPA